MKNNQILILITTVVVLYSILSPGTVNGLFEYSCRTNSECLRSEFCHNFDCISACAAKTCPETQVCQVKNHQASCLCATGYVKNYITHKCEKEIFIGKPCSNNDTCKSWEICKNKICINACGIKKCRKYQGCVSNNHKPLCICVSGFAMNTTSNKCQKEECVSNDECLGHQICNKTVDGIRICQCMHNHTRNNSGNCERNCTFDSDCLTNETCEDLKCACINSTWIFIATKYIWNNRIKECRKTI